MDTRPVMSSGISVLIVSWNSEGHIKGCLHALSQSVGRILEVIVVDNHSSDATPRIVRSEPGVELVETGANLGFAPAMNIAMQIARGPLVCLLNPDTVVAPSALDCMGTFLEQNPSVMAVAPRLLDESGELMKASVRPFPSLWETFSRQFGLSKLLPERLVDGYLVDAALKGRVPISVPCLSGAALMLRKSSIADVGLFDEVIPMYFEDIDYCARLRKMGPIYYIPDAVIVHLGAKSADCAVARRLLYAMENGEAPWLYLKRYRGSFTSGLFLGLMFIGSLFRLVLLGLVCGLARWLNLPATDRLIRIRSQSAALLWWSLCPQRKLEEHINHFFAQSPAASLDLVQRK